MNAKHAITGTKWLFGLAMALLCAQAPAQAAVLYGAANGLTAGFGSSTLYAIDTTDGNATPIGPIGFDNVTGLAFLPDGRLVGTANGDAGDTQISLLIEIDPSTGQGSLIGQLDRRDTGNCGRMPDITWDATRSTLFGYSDNCGENAEGLYVINPDVPSATLVGPSGYSGGGNALAAQPGTGVLYGEPFDSGALITLDPASGAGTPVPDSVGYSAFNAFDFDPVSGDLYASFKDWNAIEGDEGLSYLVTVDLGTGEYTMVGPTVTGLDALAFGQAAKPVSVPVDSNLMLVLLAAGLLLTVGWFMRRRGSKVSA